MAISKQTKSKSLLGSRTKATKEKRKGLWAKFAKTKTGAFLTNRYFAFGLVTVLFVLWVVWLGNYWWLIGELLIIDIYITRFVRWAFWKPRKDKKMSTLKRKTLEWVDALIFAVVAASFIRIFFFEAFTIPTSSMEKTLLIGDYLFVSKVAYGPRVPNTPISFPFVHHTLPLTKKTKSFVTWIQNDYRRLAGWGNIERDDIVVFNYPDGDTVVVQNQGQGYIDIILVKAENMKRRDLAKGKPVLSDKEYYKIARKELWNDPSVDIIVRPVDKRENYIKRCVAIPGDTLEVREGEVYVNRVKQKNIAGKQFKYIVTLKPMEYGNFQGVTGIDANELKSLGVNYEDMSVVIKTANGYDTENYLKAMENGLAITNQYLIPLTEENVGKVRAMYNVQSVVKDINEKGNWNIRIFPHSSSFQWNEDWFGPLWIPKKGTTMSIDTSNIAPYERIIGYYEHNTLKIDGAKIFINGKESKTYTFKMDYYWMMGDNRHNSADSRFWGFVPEDHVVGKAWVISFSKDKETGKIRWDRVFDKIHTVD
ncbi:MAG: signal peptidase I [Bacteroidales bacterium]|nr:signal peptidase I [Bacteroidales bacterium]